MSNGEGRYDLEERTFRFVKRTREFLKKICIIAKGVGCVRRSVR